MFGNWSWQCQDGSSGLRFERIVFGATVQEAPARAFVPAGSGSGSFFQQRLPSGDYAAIAYGQNAWAPLRFDGSGEIRWQQAAFADGASDHSGSSFGPGFGYPSLLFTNANSLSVVSTLIQEDGTDGALDIFDLDWDSGNVLATRHLPRALQGSPAVADAMGRVVIAGTNEANNLSWTRVSDTQGSEVVVVRESSSKLSVTGLLADSIGGTYVVTSQQETVDGVSTLCHMNDAQEITCALIPDLYLSGGQIIVSGGPGVLFALNKMNQLMRYDFPQ
jgi:hypothetical protein